jgi:hypothetical protein
MLLGNYNQWNANPGHSIGGVTDPTLNFKAGAFQMFYYGDSSVSGQTEKASFFVSTAPHYTFVFAPKAGGLSSRNNASVTVTATGFAVAGLPASGSTTITFTPTATGGLIVSGSGTATITISPTGTILSIAAASGTANITISPTALIGALAGLSGTANINCTPSALISAIGYLSGISTNETEFSADALARAVWDAVASDFNTAGTMGEKINDAGSAGNPWAALLVDNGDPGTFGERVQKLLTAAKFLALK